MRYGMSFSVGSGPMPHADRAAAPPPVTPRTLRNRRRFIPSAMARPVPALVMTHRTVTAHVVLHVTPDAPPHPQRGILVHLRHGRDVPVAAHARLIPQPLDVALVREPREGAHLSRRIVRCGCMT